MIINAKSSFTANEGLPAKLLSLISVGPNGKIYPRHAELNPTNRCDLSCELCGCKKRDMKAELPFEDAKQALYMLKDLSCKAITITGGGEPLLYPQINELIECAASLDIKIGIMTNGRHIHRLLHSWPTWIRISYSDCRNEGPEFFETMGKAANASPGTDWSFSYIMTRYPDYEKLKVITSFAADHNFGHIRIKPNTLDFNYALPVDEIKERLSNVPGSDLVIYQENKPFTIGHPKCLIGLLIPNIGADGNIYPCCGVEYADEEPSLDYPLKTSLGNWKNLRNIIEEQKYFDGSNCHHCYYNNYNLVLNAMTQNLKHVDFL
jgi:MoaA/NifB/PqqE/SkfB family radical SAM enzyme